MKTLSFIITASVLAISGCSNVPLGGMQQPLPVSQVYGTSQATSYGKIISVREYSVQTNNVNPLGVAGGAIVGGLLGNQIGGGKGKTLATIVGVAGGAYAGNELSKNNQQVQMVELQFKQTNGQNYTINQEKSGYFYVGQAVKVITNGNVSTVVPQ